MARETAEPAAQGAANTGAGAPPGPPRRMVFRGEDLPQHRHLSALRQALAGHCKVIPLVAPWSLGCAETWSVGGLLISHWSASAARYVRAAPRVSNDANDWVLLRLVLRGRHSVVINDRHQQTVTPDTVLLTDWSLPWVSVMSDSDYLTVAVPRRRLPTGRLFNRKLPVLRWDRQSPMGAQLSALVQVLWHTVNSVPGPAAHEADSLAQGFVGFLDGLLGSHPLLLRAQYANSSRLAAMKSLLNERLQDPHCGIDTLCDHFGCSRATVYRLFQCDGGVAAFIQLQRLHRCLAELAAPASAERGDTNDLAQRWCLGGEAQLRCLLGKNFELTPEAVLAARETAAAETEAEHDDNGKVLPASEISAAIRGGDSPISAEDLPPGYPRFHQ